MLSSLNILSIRSCTLSSKYVEGFVLIVAASNVVFTLRKISQRAYYQLLWVENLTDNDY
jgi:hypothetical protein